MRVIFNARLSIFACLLAAMPAAGEFMVGLSVADVTPARSQMEEQDYFMGGYGMWTERGPASGSHDRLSSRAFCMESAPSPEGSPQESDGFCIAVVDSLGIPGPVAKEIKTVASFQTGLPEMRILIAATHTHAAPDLLGLWGGAPDDYRNRLTRETATLITNAWRGRMPSRLFHVKGEFKAHNRRNWNDIDDALHVLFVRDPADELTLAVLVNAGVHPTVTPGSNLQLSSDFVHPLREGLAEAFQAPVIFVNGTLGDVVPYPEKFESGYWEQTEAFGSMLQREVVAMMSNRVEVQPGITFDQEQVELPVDNFVLGMAQFFGLLKGSVTGPPWSQTVTTTVSHIGIGDALSILTLPGEPLTQFGRSLKSRLPGSDQMIFGQVDDSLGYFVPADEWESGRNNDYEESVSLGRDTAPLLDAAVDRLLAR